MINSGGKKSHTHSSKGKHRHYHKKSQRKSQSKKVSKGHKHLLSSCKKQKSAKDCRKKVGCGWSRKDKVCKNLRSFKHQHGRHKAHRHRRPKSAPVEPVQARKVQDAVKEHSHNFLGPAVPESRKSVRQPDGSRKIVYKWMDHVHNPNNVGAQLPVLADVSPIAEAVPEVEDILLNAQQAQRPDDASDLPADTNDVTYMGGKKAKKAKKVGKVRKSTGKARKSVRKARKSTRKARKSTRKSTRKARKSTRKARKSKSKVRKSTRKARKSTRKARKSVRKARKSTRKARKSVRKAKKSAKKN